MRLAVLVGAITVLQRGTTGAGPSRRGLAVLALRSAVYAARAMCVGRMAVGAVQQGVEAVLCGLHMGALTNTALSCVWTGSMSAAGVWALTSWGLHRSARAVRWLGGGMYETGCATDCACMHCEPPCMHVLPGVLTLGGRQMCPASALWGRDTACARDAPHMARRSLPPLLVVRRQP